MQQIIGTNNLILEIDLTKKSFKKSAISYKDRKMYLGGKGLGLKLLYDRMKPGVDPLGEDNMIAFMMGVIMGTTAPCSGRFAAVTKSPLTGIMGTASCGGPFGLALKTSGWDGIIIKGRSEKPVYLVIDSKGVTFKNAKNIWGKKTKAAQKAIEKEGSGAMVIGPAGENLVRYANILSGHRFLGRTGMGAVLGSKNLKAIVARGKEYKIIPKNKEKFDKARRKSLRYINKNVVTAATYRNLGTSSNVNGCNAAGILPVRNFTGGMHEDAYNISGEYIRKNHDPGFHTCKPCSILCGHEGMFKGEKKAVPEYETIGLLGSNINIFDIIQISEWNEICGDLGIDTISSGSTIAWVMEAAEKGIIKSDLEFGSPKGVARALNDIAYNRGPGKDMAMGTRALSKKYGGKEFAIHVKGLDLPAYDPRGALGQGLSYAVANRGACHLSTTVFTLEIFFGMADPMAKRGKATMVKFFENLFASVNSLHTCHFTGFAYMLEPPLVKYTLRPVLKLFVQNFTPIALKLMDISLWPELWSNVMGIKLGMAGFLKAGERIHVLERYMNTREGISKKEDTLPERFLTEGRDCDNKKRVVPLDKMLNKYYKARGFDKNGIPKDKTLKRLGIEKK